MIKQLALIILLLVGIFGSVYIIRNSTLLRSFGYDVIDFVASFHASEGQAEFNPNLDIYKDGMINVLDVIKDRYIQEASRAGSTSSSASIASNSAEASNSSEATNSAN